MSKEANITYRIDSWVQQFNSDPAFTEADSEELRSHLMDLMDKLEEIGLNEEEAFIIASRRLGDVDEFEEEYKQENNQILQTRKSAIILAGILIYFFCFHFIGSTSKLLFIFLLKMDLADYSPEIWLNKYLLSAQFIIMLMITSVLLSEKKVIAFIDKLRIRPIHTITLLILTIILGIANSAILAKAKGLIRDNIHLRDRLIHLNNYFEYSLPLIFCLGFILIYYKYYRKAKI